MEVMALSVKLKEEGAATVKTAMDKLRDSVKGVQASSLLTGAAVGLLVKQAIGLADTAQLLTARLRLVTEGQENLLGVQEALRASADATRSSYVATVELFTRVARNTRSLAISQAELLRFTELTQMAIKTSGASSVEASAALIQLSQGLAAGTLRGEEFNSVMEQTPGLALAIASGLGVGVGQLRAMAQQGELTADTVVNAVLRMDTVIRKDFATMPVTVGDAFTVLKNNVLFAIKDINEALGGAGTTGLAGAIRFLATDIVPALSDGIVAFFKGFELLAVDAAIGIQKILAVVKREATQAKAFLLDMVTAGIVASGPAIKAAEEEYQALAQALEAYRTEQYALILQTATHTAGTIRETAAVQGLARAVRELNMATTERIELSLNERQRQGIRRRQGDIAAEQQAETNRALIEGARFIPRSQDLSKAFRQLTDDEATRIALLQFGQMVNETLSTTIEQNITDGLTSGIAAAISTGRIADAWRAMGQAIIQNIASAMVKVALAAIRFGTLMEKIRNFMIANPALAVASAAAMLAFAYANGGKAESTGMGVTGGRGGGQMTPLTGGMGTSDGTVTRLIFGQTSATTAAGMTPRQATNVTIIGPDDPKAQRAIEELIRKGQTRGTLG